MGRAYAYAEGDAPVPAEIQLGNAIRQYGAYSVYGRPLSAKEINCMKVAEHIVSAYQDRAQSKDMVEWAKDNMESANMLGIAFRIAEQMGLIDGS